MQGKGSIAVSNDYVKIITKVQLDGGGFNNPTVAQVAMLLLHMYRKTLYHMCLVMISNLILIMLAELSLVYHFLPIG